jgi:hypothetical protein
MYIIYIHECIFYIYIYIHECILYIYIWQMASDLLWEFLVLFSDVLFFNNMLRGYGGLTGIL